MSIQYDFDTIRDRRVSECAKWHAYDPDVLPLYVADMDFQSPQPVLEALHERVEHGIFGYPEFGTRNSDLFQCLIDLIVHTANGRMTAAEALGHREFVMTKLYRSA